MHKFFSMAQQDEITCEFTWAMDDRHFSIRLISDDSISFRSSPDDGSPWTERHGRWYILNRECFHLILYFNYRGPGFRRHMASVSLITFRDMLCLEGQDYQGRQIRMYPVEARHTGYNIVVTDAAGVLNVLAGRFDWSRL